jgi:hypothetical protein
MQFALFFLMFYRWFKKLINASCTIYVRIVLFARFPVAFDHGWSPRMLAEGEMNPPRLETFATGRRRTPVVLRLQQFPPPPRQVSHG